MRDRIICFAVAFCMSICSFYVHAQVGINTENPFASAEIDIRNIVSSGDTIPKGILIPRMTEKQRDKIDVSAVTEANGLLVYNTDEDCYNYYTKLENQWISLCGTQGSADIGPISCSDITIHGSYVEGVATTSDNYISVKTNILSPGTYSISITTENGYFFYINGTALIKGELTINIPAFGVPLSPGINDLAINGLTIQDESCKPQITVQIKPAEYSLNCSNISVYGDYYKNVALLTSNNIEVAVNVSALGSYSIQTETKNGISFYGSGVFTRLGTNVVKLYGTGTPNINADFDIKIFSDSPIGQTECSTSITVILPAMTYAIVGTGDYSWANIRSTVLANSTTFSKNGVIKMKSFTQLWTTTNGVTAADYLNNGYPSVTNGGSNAFPDVVLYFSYGSTGAATLGPALSEYIKKGGCVIYGTTDYGTAGSVAQANSILGGIFGSDYAVATGINTYATDGGQDIYPLANNLNDPILNGPFGNAVGQYWGEDNAGSIVVPKLPPNSVQLASAYNSGQKSSVNPVISIVWYNNSYNFVYFGDSVAASTTNTTTYWYPAYYPSYYPGTKLFGSQNLRRYIYNSVIELNSVAWCIRKAAVSGINTY